MAIDSTEKRYAVMGVGRPFMRVVFPIATPDEEWRMSVGNAYGGNALSPPTGGGLVLSLVAHGGLVERGGLVGEGGGLAG